MKNTKPFRCKIGIHRWIFYRKYSQCKLCGKIKKNEYSDYSDTLGLL